jgi:Tol biopolymer transport system component
MTPSWSPHGSVMGVLNEGKEYRSSLMIIDVENLSAQTLVEFNGNGAFVWSPDGESVALTREPQGESRFYNGIWHVSLDGTESKIVHDMVLAFFWSPDGRQIAYVTTSEGAEGSVRWGLVDVESGDIRYLSDFRPTEEQLNVFMFFDQYVQSHNPWSPDGSSLIYSGAIGYTKERDPLPGQDNAKVIVEDVTAGSPTEVARGILGTWSPKT